MKLLLVAGNGLSISMLRRHPVETVDLTNLFAKGGDVTWPANNRPGFLSYEHCPNLWALGARQTVSTQTAYDVIEQTITAVNACCLADPSSLDEGIYIRAYKELVAYLRYLFVHYDTELQDAHFFNAPEIYEPLDWLLDAVVEPTVASINIVSFNYDALLERCFREKAVPFSVPLLADVPGSKVRIHKPHGSITFCGKKPIDKAAFTINYAGGSAFTEGAIKELEVRYDGLDGHYPLLGMLPPAGESERYKHRWIRQIWDEALTAARSLESDDLVVLYGLSYWHVDRKEIDLLLGNVSRRARVISINPNPSSHFEAVCCSLFKSYQSYATSKQLKRMIK